MPTLDLFNIRSMLMNPPIFGWNIVALNKRHRGTSAKSAPPGYEVNRSTKFIVRVITQNEQILSPRLLETKFKAIFHGMPNQNVRTSLPFTMYLDSGDVHVIRDVLGYVYVT